MMPKAVDIWWDVDIVADLRRNDMMTRMNFSHSLDEHAQTVGAARVEKSVFDTEAEHKQEALMKL